MEKIIVGNMKMNLLTLVERERYFDSFKKEIKGKKFENSQIVLCPPAIHIEQFVKKAKTKKVAIGAQNIFWEERGAYTGEISAPMVKKVGAEYVIIGHSERRKYFSETNEIANAKIMLALKNGLTPVYCIGETMEERESGETSQVIIEQAVEGLSGISAAKISSVIVVYEPVWAVGTSTVPTSDDILEAKIILKKIFTEAYGAKVAEKINILYGGSVTAKTAKQVCVDPGMDGVLVGGASLIPLEFVKIAEIIDKN